MSRRFLVRNMVVAWALLGGGGCRQAATRHREPAPTPTKVAVRVARSTSVSTPVDLGRASSSTLTASARPRNEDGSCANVRRLTTNYPWHADEPQSSLAAVDNVRCRFRLPTGYERMRVSPGSFGAWLRELPLASADTPVRSYRGTILHAPTDPRISAVSTLDVGHADLQQCADAVMRLWGEWLWSRGQAQRVVFFAASGLRLPWSRWQRGERLVAKGPTLSWVVRGRACPSGDHESFRRFLDAVFAWSNTVALARHSVPVKLEKLQPGDFFIAPGNPGHTVLVIDVVVSSRGDGPPMALLGQSFMPAQNFHLLRAPDASPWFSLDSKQGGVMTPFWPDMFPWQSLRRLQVER